MAVRSTNPIRLLAALATFVAAYGILILGPDRLAYPHIFGINEFANIFDSLLLASIFYASIGLLIGRRAAWLVAITALIITTIWDFFQFQIHHAHYNFLITLPLFALVVLVLSHRAYSGKTISFPLRRALSRALGLTVLTTITSGLLYMLIASKDHQHLSFIQTLSYSIDHIVSLHMNFYSDQPLRSLFGQLALVEIGMINYALITYVLLRPVFSAPEPTKSEYARAHKFVARYSRDSDDYFKLYPDSNKAYFFGSKRRGVISYGVMRDTCVAIADPIARGPGAKRALIDEFSQFVRQKHWELVWLPIPESSLQLYGNFQTLKIGERALVNTQRFLDSTIRGKDFRNIKNRFEKQEFYTQWHTPPHTKGLLEEIEQINIQWRDDDHQERGFFMGQDTPEYLQVSQIFCLYNAASKIETYVSLQPHYTNQMLGIDLMRRSQEAPRDCMRYIFMELIESAAARRYCYLDLGLAPLSGLENTDKILEKLLHRIFTLKNPLFSFRGLHQFKDKFDPEWQPMYIAYSSRAQLASAAIDILRLMRIKD